MLPIGDDNPQINKPIATYTIIAFNALAWFLLQDMGGEQIRHSVCQYGLIPNNLFSADSYSNSAQGCRDIAGLGWTGIISSMFMHGSWAHILGNMWFLWIFGDNVEDSMGSVRFAIFYLIGGFCASALQVLSDPSSTIPMVGASGAIGAVMGAYIVLYPKVKVKLLVFIMVFRVPAIAMLGYWIVVQVMGGISSLSSTGGGVAFWAHVGGFVGGAILVHFFKDEELLVKHAYHGWNQTKDPADIWNDPSNRQ
jgi:membrane associated rhomboid family serine protease